MNVRREIIAQLLQVAKDHGRRLAPLTDNLALLNSGVDSLGFAILVNRLEAAFGFNPFAEDDFRNFPITLGQVYRLLRRGGEPARSSCCSSPSRCGASLVGVVDHALVNRVKRRAGPFRVDQVFLQ